MNLNKIRANSRKVLGLNERYLDYIRPENSRAAIKIADNKVVSKKVLQSNDIPVPKTITLIKSLKKLKEFNFETLSKSFVIKPVKGSRGNGVEIFYNRTKDGLWIGSNGKRFSLDDIQSLCQDILDGKFSLFNEPDMVLIEERIRPHKKFKYYTYKGTPDIRIIVYNKIPIMGMLRLPTEESEGKANLDLGAIGTGIDIAVGKSTTAIIGKNIPIEYIPKYHLPLSGFKIPFWNRILNYAVKASMVSDLGFCAIDFLIDDEKGPVIVELNARPGLSIQLANEDGLRWRLRKARGLKVKNIEQGVRLGKDLFGGEIEEEIEEISGKQVIGLIENVLIYSKDEKNKVLIKAKIDTGATISSIDVNLVKELGYTEVIEYADNILKDIPKNFNTIEEAREYSKVHNLSDILTQNIDIFDTAIIKSGNGIAYRISIKIKLEISGVILDNHLTVSNRDNLNYQIIIGERDLRNFLIDPGK